MELRIEIASEKLFRSQYQELIKSLDSGGMIYRIEEEPVGFGPEQDLILVGLVFIWESIKSGITWDIIRNEIVKILGIIESKKLKQISVYIETKRPTRRYEIECSYQNETIQMTFPDGAKIEVRQPNNRD